MYALILVNYTVGNIVCPDGNFLEQAEFCHFHQDSRNMCAPPPKLFLAGTFLPSEFEQVECACGIRGGLQICIPSKYHRNDLFTLSLAYSYSYDVFC